MGLKLSHLIPEYVETGDVVKDDMVRKLAFLAHGEAEQDEQEIDQAANADAHEQKAIRSQEQLDYLKAVN